MCGVEYLLNAVHVTGEARDDHASRRFAEHLLDGRDQVAFGDHEPGHFGVGGVDEEEIEPFFAEACEAPEVGDPTVQRELVHLEVTGVQHQPGVGTNGDGQTVGNRVVDGNELEFERAFLSGLPRLDLDQRRRDLELLELGSQEMQRQPRRDDGNVATLAQQIRDAADVVLVPVRQNDGNDVVEAIPDATPVGEDDVDAGLMLLGKQHAAVDDEQLSVEFEDGHVPADLAETARRDHAKVPCRQR
ncbi:unannotated protein [freshwater metagenome]|uniref:Unannotated protein n=1 Tax=freshwater metagenome TaxID=449393 RepID=A0A6J7IXP1_9ZZZZ